MSFIRAYNLKGHLRVHTGGCPAAPFKCPSSWIQPPKTNTVPAPKNSDNVMHSGLATLPTTYTSFPVHFFTNNVCMYCTYMGLPNFK